MPDSEEELDKYHQIDLYHSALKIDDFGNLYQVERRLDSESFNSDSTLLIDDNEKIQKLVDKSVSVYETAKFKNPTITASLYNEIQPKREYTLKESEGSFLKKIRRICDNLENEEGELHDEMSDGGVYDWRNWEYVEGIKGREYTHTDWKENFFFRVKLANEDVAVKQRKPGTRHIQGLNRLVDTQGSIARNVAGYFRINYPPDNEKEEGEGTLTTKFRVLKSKKYSIAKEEDPETQERRILKSIRDDLDEIAAKNVSEIVGLYVEFCSRRRPLEEPMDIFQLCKKLHLDTLLDRVRNAIITYWTFLGYIQLLSKYQESSRAEELFFKHKGENFMKILLRAGEYSYDQLMNDPVNGDFYRAIRYEPVNEIPVFLEQIYQELYPSYYTENWLLRHEDERQARALPRFTDKDHKKCNEDIEHVNNVYPDCILRYQVKKHVREKQKKIPMYWGTRSCPGFQRIKHWVKNILKKHKKKSRQRVFNNIEELISFADKVDTCKHIKSNIYYHKEAEADDFKAEDFCKDAHSDDCISLRDDRDKPRVFPPDMFLDAAQNSYYKTFCERDGVKARQTLTDPAIVFRLHMSKYLHSDIDRLAAEKRFDKPAVWRTKFSSTIEPYLAALKQKNPDSSIGKKDYMSRYRGLLSPEDIVRLEEENEPPTELRNTNLQDCIRSWIEKPSYVLVKTGESLVDTPDDSDDDETECFPIKRLKTVEDKRHFLLRQEIEKDPPKYENNIRNKYYLEKLDVTLEKNDIVIMCFSKDLHYVGKLRSDDIKSLIDAAEKFRQGKLNDCNWNVKRVGVELIPLIMELIDLKMKKEADPNSIPEREVEEITPKQMMNILDIADPFKLHKQNLYETNAGKISPGQEPGRSHLDSQATSKVQDFRVDHPCKGNKKLYVEEGSHRYVLQGKCIRPELVENKIRYYVLKLFVEELDELVFRKLIPNRLPHLLRYFNLMIKNRMKKQNEYKYWCSKNRKENILDTIPRVFDMDKLCESIPNKFSYSYLTDYKFTKVDNISLPKAAKLSTLRRNICNKYSLSFKNAKKCIENSIRSTVKLAKRKALLQIASTSINKSRKISHCVDKKRRQLKRKVQKVEKDINNEKVKRNAIYMSIPSLSVKDKKPYLIKINHAVASMKNDLDEFRKRNEYAYLYYMATDLYKDATTEEKQYINSSVSNVYPQFFFPSSPQVNVKPKLSLDYRAIRNEFYNAKESKQNRFNTNSKICGRYPSKDKWHFSVAPKVIQIRKETQSKTKNVAKYDKKLGVLVSEKAKKVFALPRLYKFIEWTKFSDLSQRYFLKSYDVTKRKGAFVVQFGNIILKGSEKVIKKCLLCLRMFGIQKKDLEFALILYAKLQYKDSENVFVDELTELRETFSSLCEKNVVLNQIIDMEEKLLKQNYSIPDFITWHECDEDYHLKTFIGGDKMHKPKYESFFGGLKCKKNKVRQTNSKNKLNDLHEYKYYNYHTDHNYNIKNDYSSDEGDENENHYLDNLCSCGVEKEVSRTANATQSFPEKKNIQIEYEMDDLPIHNQEKMGCTISTANTYSTSVKRIKVTEFNDNVAKDKTKPKLKANDTVQTLSPDTMLQINQFFDRVQENYNEEHVHQFINFMKDLGEGEPPELCFVPSLNDTHKQTGRSPHIPLEINSKLKTRKQETISLEKKVVPNSEKIVDAYMYTEFLNKIPKAQEEKSFISKTTVKPLELERTFNYCQNL